MSDLFLIDMETVLRDLVEQFEPTSPPSITVQTPNGGYQTFPVTEACEEAISAAERLLASLDATAAEMD